MPNYRIGVNIGGTFTDSTPPGRAALSGAR